MKCSIGLSPSRLVPTHFAALLASSGSLRHALSGLLTSAKRFADPRGLKERSENGPAAGAREDKANCRPEWRQSGKTTLGARSRNH